MEYYETKSGFKFLAKKETGKTANFLKKIVLLISSLGFFYNVALGINYNWRGSNRYKNPIITPLRSRGFSLIPTPQEVDLGKDNVVVDESWTVVPQIDQDDIAVQRLRRGGRQLHHLTFSENGDKTIVLSVQQGTVKGTDNPTLNNQGYLLKIAPSKIEIIGNSKTGLFYGVQSLLQLLRRNSKGDLIVPEAEIKDWPKLQLRFVHWDTKHHQDRMKTLKRYLDWAAYFKVNMIAFEIWDKFKFPSHPGIGAPGAFTSDQLQELVDYAKKRHIQIVPDIQAPSHFQWVLKYPQFADLRANGIDYQACLCNDKTYKLIFSLYQDILNATKGVDYFLVSTDELYYAGICDMCKRPYNDRNRSLAWVDFANKAHDWLAKRDRKMIAWVEWPLLAKDIPKLSSDIIDGVGRAKTFLKQEAKNKMHQLVYSSIQGSEYLFPNYFSTKYRNSTESTLQRVSNNVNQAYKDGANPIGTFAAAWDDSGLHNETFWLGWATVTQYGWTPDKPSVQQNVASFMDIYYGPKARNMIQIYEGLEKEARFFQSSWDQVSDETLKPEYNSYSATHSFLRHSMTLPQPALPKLPGLIFTRVYNGKYGKLVKRAKKMENEAESLKYLLYENEHKVDHNHYNIEVLLSIADFASHHDRMIMGMAKIEDYLSEAYKNELSSNFEEALKNLIDAYSKGENIIADRKDTFNKLKKVWGESRYPKGQTVNGKKFFHVLDDVQDYWANRTADLSFMIKPEKRINLKGWLKKLKSRIHQYSKNHDIEMNGMQIVSK